MRKFSAFFLFLIIVSITANLTVLNIVNAIPNYEWIQNPSFEGYTNYFEDGSAESGAFNSGVQYGNFSTSDTWTISTNYPYNGLKNFYVQSANSKLFYNLTTSIIGADLQSFYFYIREVGASGHGFTVLIYYSDGTSDSHGFSVSTTYTKYNLLSYINTQKYVIAFSFSPDTSNGFVLDVLVLHVNIGESQSEINQYSDPWFIPYSGSVEFRSDLANYGNQSIRAISAPLSSNTFLGLSFPIVAQSISGLSSSSITGFNLWAYSAELIGSVRAFVWFSDNTYAQKSVSFNSANTWQFFNFYSLLTDNPSKTIISIGFCESGYPLVGYVSFDDVSLTANIPYSTGQFSFYLIPSAQQYNLLSQTGYGFHAYYGVSYAFYGTLTDNTNGTFTVYSNYGSGSGVISNGLFNFQITIRQSASIENFIIQINNDIVVRTYVVIANWIKTPTPPIDNVERGNQFLNAFPMILIFAIFIIPSTYFLGIGGFIGGLSVGTIVCVWSGLAPSWLIAVVILTDIVIIFFSAKRNPETTSNE